MTPGDSLLVLLAGVGAGVINSVVGSATLMTFPLLLSLGVPPVVANVSAAKETDPAAIRDLLVQQVTATVRWRECIQAMVGLGVDSFVELGAGKVLSGLVKRIAPDAAAISAATPAEVEAVLKTL